MNERSSLANDICEEARRIGFDLVGIAPAIQLPHADQYKCWLSRNFHGELGYLERNQSLRVDPRNLFEPTRTVISVGLLYGKRGEDNDGFVARYARGMDYHDIMRAMLEELAAFVNQAAGEDVQTRPCVDTAPLLERDVAILAGLGWLGKSSCVINQDLGSYLLLGELCISLDLPANRERHPDRCGICTRCIDACPTDAIVEPYVIDARRCISYLTIELKGPIPRELRAGVGTHLFGCDICQSVCPWNRKAPDTRHDAFAPHPDIQNLSLVELLHVDEQEFRRRFRKTPLWRPRRRGLLRNACVVLGNLGDPGTVPDLCDALQDQEPLVRSHAAWALGRIGGPNALAALTAAVIRESDPDVAEEIVFALELAGRAEEESQQKSQHQP